MSKEIPHFTCPYCLEVNPITGIHFKCYRPGDECPQSIIPTVTGSNTPESASCPICKKITQDIACPNCHNQLDRSTLDKKDVLISVVGTRDGGKSNYIAALIHELTSSRAIKDNFKLSIEPYNEEIRKRYADTYGDYLFPTPPEKSRRLRKTDRASAASAKVYEPYIYKVHSTRKGLAKSESFNLVIFDIAGDDLEHINDFRDTARYIGKSDGIIFLVDPVQQETLFHRFPEDILNQSTREGALIGNTAAAIISRMAELIENEARLSHKDVKKIPIAAAFTKIDALKWEKSEYNETPIIQRKLEIFEPSKHRNLGAFDSKTHKTIHDEMHSLLLEWRADSFTGLLDTHFHNYSYFAVSALGQSYKQFKDETITRPMPHRVEDPLLWILKEKAIIKSVGGGLREIKLNMKHKFRPFSKPLMWLFVIIVLALIVAVSIPIFSNMRNANDLAFLNMEMTQVYPRTGLRGSTSITASFEVTNRNFGWGRQRITFTLERRDDGSQVELTTNQQNRFFSYWFIDNRTITLFTYYFEPGSDYVLHVLLNGNPFRPVELHGE